MNPPGERTCRGNTLWVSAPTGPPAALPAAVGTAQRVLDQLGVGSSCKLFVSTAAPALAEVAEAHRVGEDCEVRGKLLVG